MMRGPKRTIAEFRGIKREFSTSVEAYVFLLDSFVRAKPDLFDIASKIGFPKGRKRKYVARDPKILFGDSLHLVDRNNYAPIACGWYAITNLSNPEKSKILFSLAGIAKFGPDDWSWNVVDQEAAPAATLDDL